MNAAAAPSTPPIRHRKNVYLLSQSQRQALRDAFGAVEAISDNRGFQFYAGTRERVEVRFTDELRAKTHAAIEACRRLSALDSPPDPLPLRTDCHGPKWTITS